MLTTASAHAAEVDIDLAHLMAAALDAGEPTASVAACILRELLDPEHAGAAPVVVARAVGAGALQQRGHGSGPLMAARDRLAEILGATVPPRAGVPTTPTTAAPG
jgi:hypothetical protein